MQKPSIPKGTRDFGPLEMARRNYIFDQIKSVFQKYGYQSIETPSMENLSTLLGKYGDEGDKLLFKVLNSGDYLHSAGILSEDGIVKEAISSSKLTNLISEKGLRYDLTVPFARYVVQHRNDIQFPFKRYQIQPVWRADRPQKGRYREFYQCDVDVIGSNSLLNEVELIQIVEEIFHCLEIQVSIHINNRKILAGIAEIIGEPEKFMSITIAIDKLDKIGIEGVNKELETNGISLEAIEKLQPIFALSGNFREKLDKLSMLLAASETGTKGVAEMRTIIDYLDAIQSEAPVVLDLTLARGLNYYTGAIFEVKAQGVSIGSICGGGRYDDLTGVFGLSGVSGVGVSFGADRIYDVLNELNLFPEKTVSGTKVLVTNFGGNEEKFALGLLKNIRKLGIPSEIYPETSNLKKQLGYADSKKIEFVIIAGSEELEKNEVKLKEMKNGTHSNHTPEGLLSTLQSIYPKF
jgi:histidyl-tRNA synthetase